MTFGIQILPADAPSLPMTGVSGYRTSNHKGINGVSYFEFATENKQVWEGWLLALDSANRPYKFIIGINGHPVSVNSANW